MSNHSHPHSHSQSLNTSQSNSQFSSYADSSSSSASSQPQSQSQPSSVPPVIRQLWTPNDSSSADSSKFSSRNSKYSRSANSNSNPHDRRIQAKPMNQPRVLAKYSNENAGNQTTILANHHHTINNTNKNAAVNSNKNISPHPQPAISSATAQSAAKSAADNPVIPPTQSSTPSAVPAHSQSAFSPFGPVKLIDRRFKFCLESVDPHLLDASNFSVIGILGFQNVGKSTIINGLINQNGSNNSNNAAAESKGGRFPVSTSETILRCGSDSVGADCLITSDRCILIDTQPLLSWSVFSSMVRDDLPVHNSVSLETLFEFESLQLALLLFCVCHVVLIACEHPLNPKLFRILRTVAMMKETLSTTSFLRADANDGNPDLVFVVNKCVGLGGNFGRIQELIGKYLGKTAFRRNGAIGNEAGSWSFGVNLFVLPMVEENRHEEKYEKNEKSIETRGIEEKYSLASGSAAAAASSASSSSSSLPNSLSSFSSSLSEFRSQIFSAPKLLQTSKMSEREWLRYAGRVWNELINSAAMAEYRRILDKKNAGVQSSSAYSRN